MAADRIETCLLNVGGKQSGAVLEVEFRACVSDPKHAKSGNDSDDCNGNQHLRDGESLLSLSRRCSAVAFHFYGSTSETPDKTRLVHLWQEPFRR